VNYSVKGKAKEGIDYTLDSAGGQIVIPAGQSSATITLHAVADAIKEKNEKAQITLGNGTGYQILKSRKKAIVTIVNVL
jgi:hypothetical protein